LLAADHDPPRFPISLEGRAWSGTAPIIRGGVVIDGEWFDAELDEPVGECPGGVE
jgi:hypothetical protein